MNSDFLDVHVHFSHDDRTWRVRVANRANNTQQLREYVYVAAEIGSDVAASDAKDRFIEHFQLAPDTPWESEAELPD